MYFRYWDHINLMSFSKFIQLTNTEPECQHLVSPFTHKLSSLILTHPHELGGYHPHWDSEYYPPPLVMWQRRNRYSGLYLSVQIFWSSTSACLLSLTIFNVLWTALFPSFSMSSSSHIVFIDHVIRGNELVCFVSPPRMWALQGQGYFHCSVARDSERTWIF